MAICVIPARGGSKRIPQKNIREFMGKPMLAYPIDAVQKSGACHRIIVSTDDPEIAGVAKKYGAEVPFFRSSSTADDFTPVAWAVAETLAGIGLSDSTEWVLVVFPCSPMMQASMITQAFDLLQLQSRAGENASSLMTVVPYGHPIQRSLIKSGNFVTYSQPQYRNTRSQDLDAHFHDVGQLYIARACDIVAQKTLACAPTVGFVVSETSVQDIDTLEDWQLAELKYCFHYRIPWSP